MRTHLVLIKNYLNQISPDIVMENSSKGVTCPNHPTELIQRVNTDLFASQHLYCLECILQHADVATKKPQLKSIPEFLNEAAAIYLQKRKEVQITSKTPNEYIHIISKQNEVLDELSSHIAEQKQKVESIFEEIAQYLISILAVKKNEYQCALDKQILNLRYWYIFFEKQVKKTYPTPEDIPQLFPSREDLMKKLEKITNITQLTAFVRGIKEDLNEDKIDLLKKRTREDDAQSKLKEISMMLNQITSCKPSFDTKNLEGLGAELDNWVEKVLHNKFSISNPISDVLENQIQTGLDSKIIQVQDYELIKEWLPDKLKSLTPTLLYRGTRDGKGANDFHSKCDGKGPTITLIKCKFGSESRVIGGFIDREWTSKDLTIQTKKAFLFSTTLKLKYPLNNGGAANAAFGVKKFGPTFGAGYDLCISDQFVHSSGMQSTYKDSGKLFEGAQMVSPNIFGPSKYHFEPEEVEVFLLN